LLSTKLSAEPNPDKPPVMGWSQPIFSSPAVAPEPVVPLLPLMLDEQAVAAMDPTAVAATDPPARKTPRRVGWDVLGSDMNHSLLEPPLPLVISRGSRGRRPDQRPRTNW
jgi:hypothetical protein